MFPGCRATCSIRHTSRSVNCSGACCPRRWCSTSRLAASTNGPAWSGDAGRNFVPRRIMFPGIRPYAQAIARLLEPSTAVERERRTAHALALLLVAIVATLKVVSGLTHEGVPFTFFLIAVCGAAARGGFAPALVAALASVLVADLGASKQTPA